MSSSPPPPADDGISALLQLVEGLDADHERLRQRVLELMEWMEASVTAEVRTERELDAWQRQAENLAAELDAVHGSSSWRLTSPLRAMNGRVRRRTPGPSVSPVETPDAARSATDRVPVFIPVRDRVTPLRAVIEWLERAGHDEIWLIDNASTYGPLVELLDSTVHRVVRLDRNLGHRSPFLSGVVQREAAGRHFVITDPDVVPDGDCPLDAVAHFREILDRYPEIDKVGFGLRIDDLPVGYPLVDEVAAWEKRFWSTRWSRACFEPTSIPPSRFYRPFDRRHREDRPCGRACAVLGPSHPVVSHPQRCHRRGTLVSRARRPVDRQLEQR